MTFEEAVGTYRALYTSDAAAYNADVVLGALLIMALTSFSVLVNPPGADDDYLDAMDHADDPF